MNYFFRFPQIIYNERLVTDIVRSIKKRTVFDQSIMQQETVRDGERIDEFAHRVYQDASLWWIIALVNNISNVTDWPLSNKELNDYILRVHGSNAYEVKYLIDADGKRIPVSSPGEFTVDGKTVDWHIDQTSEAVFQLGFYSNQGTPITYYEDERIINLDKRNMQYVSTNNLGAFIEDFETQMESSV